MKNNINKILAVWLCVVMFATVFSVAAPSNASTNTTNNSIEYDYVIITTNAIVENSEELDFFINMKEWCGHSVKVVTETDFLGKPGADRADKIRQWLIDNEGLLGIDYVLLIGNPDPDDPSDPPNDVIGDIPMKHGFPNYFSWKCWDNKSSYRGVPTDYYYADLDSNWDLDGDGFYGEAHDVDADESPYPGEINTDYFSIRWTGYMHCDFNENYEFIIFSDGGVRFWLDGSLVIDNWDDFEEHGPTNDKYTTPSDMSIGLHSITLEYKEHTEDAIVNLMWGTTVNKNDPNYLGTQNIPLDHLRNETDEADGLTGKFYNNIWLSEPYDRLNPDGEEVNKVWATGDRGAGGPDLDADVLVGRIPVYDNDYAQLDYILRKIIKYETAQPGVINWRKSALLPMAPLTTSTPAYHYGEEVRDFALPLGFSCYRIYWDDYAPSGPTPEDYPTDKTKVRNEWQNGYGVVTYWTHGGSGGAKHIFDNTMTHHLDDTKPSFTYQATCMNGFPESSNNLGYALLKHGAVATVSSTRVSGGSRGNWTYDPNSGANPNFGYAYLKHIIVDGYHAGMALYEAKSTVANMGRNEMNYNLYGDPTCYLLTTFPNDPPVADANGPYEADEGSPVFFNASGSYDPEGDPLEYRWDFENDGVWDTDWSTGPTASYTWGDDHLGLVKVEVRDKLGFTANDTGLVIVYNVAPTITSLTMGQSNPQFILPYVHDLMFEGSFTDPGWLDTHTSTWNFGDGTIVSGTLIEENNEPNATGTITGQHVYTAPGIYTVTLTVTDDDGGICSDTMIVIVVDEFEALHDIDDYIQNLDESFFKGNPTQRKNTFKRMIAAVHNLLVVEEYVGAIRDLRYNIRAKADGYVDGNPKNDWIIDPTAQAEICMKIDDLTAYLEYLDSQT